MTNPDSEIFARMTSNIAQVIQNLRERIGLYPIIENVPVGSDTPPAALDVSSAPASPPPTTKSKKTSLKSIEREGDIVVAEPVNPNTWPVVPITWDMQTITPPELFKVLVSQTCPYRFEDRLYGDQLRALGWEQDQHGNYHYQVGPMRDKNICFCAHLDTITGAVPSPVVVHEDRGWLVTDGRTTLGADDKAGCTIVLWLAHRAQVEGHYTLFVGEEYGCKGSSAAARSNAEFWGGFGAMVAFDRANYNDIITHQRGTRTCSEAFAQALASEINSTDKSGTYFKYKPCANGVYTDSAEFDELIPECTNVSVGYQAQHGTSERQDWGFLESLCYVLGQVRWRDLPIMRDPTVKKTWGGYKSSSYWSAWGAYDDDDVAASSIDIANKASFEADAEKAAAAEAADRDAPWYDDTIDWLISEAMTMGTVAFDDLLDICQDAPELAAFLLLGFINHDKPSGFANLRTLGVQWNKLNAGLSLLSDDDGSDDDGSDDNRETLGEQAGKNPA